MKSQPQASQTARATLSRVQKLLANPLSLERRAGDELQAAIDAYSSTRGRRNPKTRPATLVERLASTGS